MPKIQILNPRGSVKREDKPVARGLDSLQGKVIGIIDNGQSNSTTMFQELAKLLEERVHPAQVIFKTKPSHMQGAPKSIVDEFANRCDAVITGLGA